MDKKKLNVLTKRQRDVWELHEQGLSRKQIAERLGITYNAVVQHLHLAERRFRQYDQHCAIEVENQKPASLPLTRGEVKLIIEALSVYEEELLKGAHKAVNVDWVGRLPVKTKFIADLHRKAQIAIYGQQFQHILPDDFYDEGEGQET